MILPVLRVVVPNAKELVWSVREVVYRNGRDFFALEAGLCAKSKGDFLLRRLRLSDQVSNLVVRFNLVELDTLHMLVLR